MYKVTVTNKYNLLQYSLYAHGFVQVESFNTVAQLKIYVKKNLPKLIHLNEIDVAIKQMLDTTHNTAEFGGAGCFTVSYYDEDVDVDN